VPESFHVLAIYSMHYNYVRIHQILGATPAMAAGVSKTLWSMDEVMKIVDEWEAARDGSGMEYSRRLYMKRKADSPQWGLLATTRRCARTGY